MAFPRLPACRVGTSSAQLRRGELSMAINVMSWAWRESRADGADLLVLLAIADQSNEDGGGAWPSVVGLATRARVSVRTVQRCLARLIELGELEVQYGAGHNGVNVYRVLMEGRPATPSACHPVSLSPRQPVTPTNDPKVGHSRQGGGDTHVIQPIQVLRTKNLHVDADRADVERVCQHLADRIEANGSRRPTVSDNWRTAARLMLDRDKRTEERIIRAIDWCQADEFWRANILSMSKLRAKYDQLRLAAQRSSPAVTGGKAEPPVNWMTIAAGSR